MKAPVACLLLVVASLRAQPPDYFVQIQLTNGQQVNAWWVRAEARGLTVQLSADPTMLLFLQPEEIGQININRSHAARRNAWWGASVGFVVGFAADWTAHDDHHQGNLNQIGRAAGTGLLAASVGALAGFALGIIPKTYRIGGSPMQYSHLLPKLLKYNPK
jgi:hypothetical protein